MKKGILMIILAVMVIASVVLWFVKTTKEIQLEDIAKFGVILLVVGFAVVVAFKKIRSAKADLPSEDELSKKVMQKAASLAYFVSLYWWLILGFFSERIKLETHSQIGIGIIGMAVLLATFWFYYNYKGKFNE